MLKHLFRLLLPLLPLLVGCADPEAAGGPEPHPVEAYTWKEWVERETPKIPERFEHIGGYHRCRGLPNMEKWRPEDFLPKEYPKRARGRLPHRIDICRGARYFRGSSADLNHSLRALNKSG